MRAWIVLFALLFIGCAERCKEAKDYVVKHVDVEKIGYTDVMGPFEFGARFPVRKEAEVFVITNEHDERVEVDRGQLLHAYNIDQIPLGSRVRVSKAISANPGLVCSFEIR